MFVTIYAVSAVIVFAFLIAIVYIIPTVLYITYCFIAYINDGSFPRKSEYFEDDIFNNEFVIGIPLISVLWLPMLVCFVVYLFVYFFFYFLLRGIRYIVRLIKSKKTGIKPVF